MPLRLTEVAPSLQGWVHKGLRIAFFLSTALTVPDSEQCTHGWPGLKHLKDLNSNHGQVRYF